jgi:hypothetical protein
MILRGPRQGEIGFLKEDAHMKVFRKKIMKRRAQHHQFGHEGMVGYHEKKTGEPSTKISLLKGKISKKLLFCAERLQWQILFNGLV